MMKRSILSVLLLSIITCGIYLFFWMYATRSELKQYLDNDPSINPGLEVLLSILCFPYFYYWFYKYSRDIIRAQAKAGLPQQDEAILNLILSIFGLSLVAVLIIQGQLNELADKAE